MAKKKSKRSKYTTQASADAQTRHRLLWTLNAALGDVEVSEAARELGISRTQMHELVNRLSHAMVDAVSPKKAGRPARSATEKELEAENQRLKRENERLQQRVNTVDRLLGVASEMMKGRIQPKPRTKKQKKKAAESAGPEPEDPDDARKLLEGVMKMRSLGLTAELAAAVAGYSPQTIARWKRREAQGRPLRHKRGGGPCPRSTPEAAAEVDRLVRELRGSVSAGSLSNRLPDISRRQAARIKQETLMAMERERRQRSMRVTVTTPGVVRGFDQLVLRSRRGRRYGLIAADAAVPFRTTGELVARYDSPAVTATLEKDIARHGAPLVYRLDRASCHRTDDVAELCAAHGVLILHGPPSLPRFYGQTERQNLEHRNWLGDTSSLDDDELALELDQMRTALNGLKPRRTLDFRTAEEVWNERPTLQENRSQLRLDVEERAARIVAGIDDTRARGSVADLAQRIAIEQALTQRGYLRCEIGGWC